jgi:hypothetical protein
MPSATHVCRQLAALFSRVRAAQGRAPVPIDVRVHRAPVLVQNLAVRARKTTLFTLVAWARPTLMRSTRLVCHQRTVIVRDKVAAFFTVLARKPRHGLGARRAGAAISHSRSALPI